MKDPRDVSDKATPPGSRGSTSESLLARVRAGDEAGWRRFVDLYTPLVLYWCLQRGMRGDAAEEVAQEVFLTVASKVAGFHQRLRRGSFRAWLKRITRFKLQAHYRHLGQAPRPIGGSKGQEILAEVRDDPPVEDAEEDGATEQAILRRRALELVRAECDARTWEAAYRVIAEGQRPAEVAAALGMTTNAVYIAKSRVLARGRAIAEEFEDPTPTKGLP